jgi:hypothetical protein
LERIRRGTGDGTEDRKKTASEGRHEAARNEDSKEEGEDGTNDVSGTTRERDDDRPCRKENLVVNRP